MASGCPSGVWCHRLTHWGRVTFICVSKLTIIGSDNGLSPGWRQAIIWTNAGILLIRTLGTNFSEIISEVHAFSFKKMHLKMSSAKWRLFGLGLNELITLSLCSKWQLVFKVRQCREWFFFCFKNTYWYTTFFLLCSIGVTIQLSNSFSVEPSALYVHTEYNHKFSVRERERD